MSPELQQLALAAGLLPEWEDVYKRRHQVPEASLRYLLNSLGLPCATPGQIRESLHSLPPRPRTTGLAVPPVSAQGLAVEDLTGPMHARAWGLIAQVYSLRSEPSVRTRGSDIFPGEYGAVSTLAQVAAGLGASALALSPVHAMFSADPSRYSPYSPSSRLFLNTAFIDPAQVLGGDMVTAAISAGVGYPPATDPLQNTVWSELLPVRLQVLRQLFSDFRQHGTAAWADDFRAFRQQGGWALEQHARYEALHAQYAPALGAGHGWQDWPAHFHDPAGPDVQAWAEGHDEDIEFHCFLQWLADKNVSHAQRTARGAGMGIGLISDLAIGTDPRGSHAWSHQGQMLAGVSVGAPPDLIQPLGQDWGLTAFSPLALQANNYRALVEVVQAALRYAGGVRIDHILGMARMWLIPEGASAQEGVYLRYPLDDMLRIIVQQASQHHAMVIGENLGTVPQGFNQTLQDTGILGTSVLWFEREETPTAPFIPARLWSAHSVAMPSTHDLPTVNGWWQGRDLYWREQHGMLSGAALEQEISSRHQDKAALRQALQDEGLLTPENSALDSVPLEAILAFVAQTPAPLALFSLEDVLGLVEQPNVPGSAPATGGHPNWCRRLPLTVTELSADPQVNSSVAAIVHARRSSS